MSTRKAAERGRQFVLKDRQLDNATGEAVFDYELDGEEFSEHVRLPAGSDADPRRTTVLLDLCHVVIGTSYYKLTAPLEIAARRPLSPEAVTVCVHAYDEGLREFCNGNDLPIPLDFDLDVDVARRPPPPVLPSAQRPLAPIGGGKDSAAVLSLVPNASAVAISATPVQRGLASAAGVALVEVERSLDPKLERLTPMGFNGHIPVTAINSALAGLAAHLNGFDSVVMGNERSASEPTRIVNGFAINHQYSKSFDFEVLLHTALATAGIAYFSVLRQLSELSIAAIVSKSHLRRSFLSCNRAFRRSRQSNDRQTWCLECPKCLFTFLCFAPFLAPSIASEVFGGNPLSDEALAPNFRALWHDEEKPFDCVGERGESAAALAHLAAAPGWSEMPVVRFLAADAQRTRSALGVDLASLLRPAGPMLTPEPYAAMAADAARAVATPC